jgi:ABC-type nitrate/sulfonate/bicarbonate transport system permease component
MMARFLLAVGARRVLRAEWVGKIDLVPLLSISAVVAGWWVITAYGGVSDLVLPSPDQVVRAAVELVRRGELQRHILISVLRVTIGFSIGVVAGGLVGGIMGLWKLADDALRPVVDMARQISPVAWIPLAILWFGFGEGSKVYIVFLGTFFPVAVTVASGIAGVDERLVWAARSLGASGLALLRVVLAAALPQFVSGAIVGFGNSARFIVAAELAGAQSGIGYLMMTAQEAFRADLVLVGVVALAAVGSIGVSLMERITQRWLLWYFRESG